jgi:HEAT repeat protein
MTARHLRMPGPLEAAELTGNEDELVEALRHVKSEKSRRQDRANQVLKILKETGSPRVRNAAAIALADMKVTTAKDELVKLLSRDATKYSRGSLLYALEEMKAQIPLTVLADIIAGDDYEAREEALRFLEHQKYDLAELRRTKQKLKRSLGSTREQAEATSAAGNYLSKRLIQKK